jgi:hypothetical protein
MLDTTPAVFGDTFKTHVTNSRKHRMSYLRAIQSVSQVANALVSINFLPPRPVRKYSSPENAKKGAALINATNEALKVAKNALHQPSHVGWTDTSRAAKLALGLPYSIAEASELTESDLDQLRAKAENLVYALRDLKKAGAPLMDYSIRAAEDALALTNSFTVYQENDGPEGRYQFVAF